MLSSMDMKEPLRVALQVGDDGRRDGGGRSTEGGTHGAGFGKDECFFILSVDESQQVKQRLLAPHLAFGGDD